MGTHYRHFDLDERIELARLSGAGHSVRQIASALDRAPSSIARELKRNRGSTIGYKPVYADQQARARRWCGCRLERDEPLRNQVLGQLAAGWSPEQVAGRSGRIGAESIYRFVYAQITRHKDYRWRHYLPRAKSKRGRRARRGGSSLLHMAHRLSLAERPAEVDGRAHPGHWEADLMAFSRYGQNILMLHERTSRALLGYRLASKQADLVASIIGRSLERLPQAARRTVTFDNGTEFARHYWLHQLGIATYFCDAHAPWQKGGIENAIGRMRRFLPRKTDLAIIADNSFNALIIRYNNTPRKCLGWKTPAEVFNHNVLHFERESTFPPARE